jgi:hypothetical protein
MNTRALIGDGWEVPDGVEFPVEAVEVLVIRNALWRHDIEEWEDTMTGECLSGVMSYRDTSPPIPEIPPYKRNS